MDFWHDYIASRALHEHLPLFGVLMDSNWARQEIYELNLWWGVGQHETKPVFASYLRCASPWFLGLPSLGIMNSVVNKNMLIIKLIIAQTKKPKRWWLNNNSGKETRLFPFCSSSCYSMIAMMYCRTVIIHFGFGTPMELDTSSRVEIMPYSSERLCHCQNYWLHQNSVGLRYYNVTGSERKKGCSISTYPLCKIWIIRSGSFFHGKAI